MSRFNLSEWALRNRGIVLYFMLAFAVIGAWSYTRLGQSEDPPFTFKVMIVQTFWPGATADEIQQQINERIETTLMETGQYEFVRSYARPGESTVLFLARDALHSRDLPELWYQIRKKVGDIRHELPAGIVGPFFNDEFGDTFGNIYALSGDGFSYAELKDYARRVQLELLRVPDVAKVELIGLQDERVWIELSNAKIATLGVRFDEVLAALAAQNAVAPAGFFETGSDRIYLRTTGPFDSIASIENLAIRAGDRVFRLADVATVRRGFTDPPQPRMRFMGESVVGLGVSMAKGGDIIRLGHALDANVARIQSQLPAGLQLRQVANQPRAVRSSINEFLKVLAEAVTIVLVVSFFSLGFRTGLVVALSIPLVLAMTFAAMHFFGIGLHKISLGALILALGLLVDDAIIAVEMMARKLEEGLDRLRAAAFAWNSTAFPMLTGTLVTAAGFLPIATAASNTGEYTRSIFQVVSIALVLSWIVAVLFTPYLGWHLLPDAHGNDARGGGGHADPYDKPFYRRLRVLIEQCVDRRWTVIGLTAAALAISIAGFGLVQQQFFPASTRLELLIDIKLPEGSSLQATDMAAKRLEAVLADDPDIENFVAHVGAGSPRFYLPLDQQLPQPSFAQFVVLTRDIAARERVRARLIESFQGPGFTDLRGRVLRLENGPPVGYPLQFRVEGEDIATIRAYAREVADLMRANPHVANVHLDWDEPSKVIRLVIDQDRARLLGVSSLDVANLLQSSLTGRTISEFREADELIPIVLRGPEDERAALDLLGSLAVPTASGHAVPLAQIARIEYGFEDGLIWRRNRLPTITVRADVYGTRFQPATIVKQLEPGLARIRASMPPGYLLEIGGTVEESARGAKSVAAGVPLFVLVVTTLLMLQLKSFSRVAMVWLTAPLGIIGVVAFLLLLGRPFGFVAMLGTIALAGMIMRNSVILVDQIEQDIAAGKTRFDAIVGATVRRFRPIVLTALAAVLAMIPLSRSVFFGPMAVAIMGGLISATALTILFLPALYAAWFRVRRDEPVPSGIPPEPDSDHSAIPKP